MMKYLFASLGAYLLLNITPIAADLNWTPWDLSPWFTRTFEFYPQLQYRLQGYQHVIVDHDLLKNHARDHLVDLSLEVSPFPPWSTAIAFSAMHLQHHSVQPEDAELLIRYQLLDDVIGDPVSLVFGVRGLYIFKHARRAIAIFNRGDISAEALVTIGREWSQGSQWLWRIWGLGAYGTANVGSPWWRASFTIDTNYCDYYHAALFCLAIGGLGQEMLHPYPFHGYGPVKFRAIDIGGRVRCYFENGSYLDGSYARRVHAYNAPHAVNQVALAYTYPFGL